MTDHHHTEATESEREKIDKDLEITNMKSGIPLAGNKSPELREIDKVQG